MTILQKISVPLIESTFRGRRFGTQALSICNWKQVIQPLYGQPYLGILGGPQVATSKVIPCVYLEPRRPNYARTFSNSPNTEPPSTGSIHENDKEDDAESDGEYQDEKRVSSDSDHLYQQQCEQLVLTPEEIKEISGGDPEVEKKIQFILMEHELLRQEGKRVPSSIRLRNWSELLALKSRHQRHKFYSFLWKTEMKMLGDKRRKEAKAKKRNEDYAANPIPTIEEDPHWMTYGINRNTIFMRLYDQKIAAYYHHRIIPEMIHGTPLVFDCGYDDQMVFREAKNCAAQIEYLLTDNRNHPQPFNLVFCNANPSSNLMTQLNKRIPSLYDDAYAVEIYEKSYTDLYPREKLVYLSPHAREEMTEFSEDEIYIVGAIVDKTDPRPFSLAKAKKEGIRIKKLPLDSKVDWGLGHKALTLNQFLNILLEIRASGDWEKALRFIPTRKLIGGRKECPPLHVIDDYRRMNRESRGFRPYDSAIDDSWKDQNSIRARRQELLAHGLNKQHQFRDKHQQYQDKKQYNRTPKRPSANFKTTLPDY